MPGKSTKPMKSASAPAEAPATKRQKQCSKKTPVAEPLAAPVAPGGADEPPVAELESDAVNAKYLARVGAAITKIVEHPTFEHMRSRPPLSLAKR